MNGTLDGRIAMVTGAGSGIGAAVMRRLAQDGAIVIAVDQDLEAARRMHAAIGGKGTALRQMSPMKPISRPR